MLSTFQDNWYYDLPLYLRWEIQSFVQVDKPPKHADAVSIIKAKNSLVRPSWSLYRTIFQFLQQLYNDNEPVSSNLMADLDASIQVIAMEILEPKSLKTMSIMNIKMATWCLRVNEHEPDKNGTTRLPLLSQVMERPITHMRTIEFKPNIRIKACELY